MCGGGKQPPAAKPTPTLAAPVTVASGGAAGQGGADPRRLASTTDQAGVAGLDPASTSSTKSVLGG